MHAGLTAAQQLKFRLLAEGMVVHPRALALLSERIGDRSLSPADYASTSGLILRLEDEVWVNAPIKLYNPNFVFDSELVLDADPDGLLVRGAGLESRAQFWPQPQYHGTANEFGPLNNFAVSHGDRVRLSPLRSCAMVCTFCNIPYDDPISVYQLKPVDALVAAARTALADPCQPAHHLLISGGTPKPKDVGYLRDVYRWVLEALPGVDLDIMMVPLPGLFDLAELNRLGLRELSVNLEVYGRERAREVARQKYNQGLDFYLDFIEEGSEALGRGRVRSMLMVGLEPIEDTLAGVRAIAERGGVPVLSPFRPDPATPLRDVRPPSAAELTDVFLRATEVATAAGGSLGPECPPCSHNTLTLMPASGADYRYPLPLMV